MHRRLRGGLQCRRFPDADFDAEVLCMPRTSGCFFTVFDTGKGAVCKFAGNFGLDGESAGGNGTEVTLNGYI